MKHRKWRSKGSLGEKMDAHLTRLFEEWGFRMDDPAIINTIGVRRYGRAPREETSISHAMAILEAEAREFRLRRIPW